LDRTEHEQEQADTQGEDPGSRIGERIQRIAEVVQQVPATDHE
jgi:hypothetical protein